MRSAAATAILACAVAFVPPRPRRHTAVVLRAGTTATDDDDDDWRRLANSKDAAADVFLGWAAEDPGLGACLRTLNLRRGRFGGDVPPTLWPVQLRRKLARGLGRRGRARSARRAAWAGANEKQARSDEERDELLRYAAYERFVSAERADVNKSDDRADRNSTDAARRRRQRAVETEVAASLELSWRDLRAAYAEREAVVRNVNGAAEDLAGAWVYHLGLLQAYAQNHDSARPPASYVAPCGARLGRWLADQRSLDKRGRLAPARRQQLELIGGDVSPLAAHAERRWRRACLSLWRFRRREGHAKVHRTFADEDGFGLGGWLVEQRRRHEEGTLPPKRARALETLGVSFERPRARAWRLHFEALETRADATGRADAPARFVTPEGLKLGQWVAKQRRLKREGALAPERERRLSAIRFVWAPRAAVSRDAAYAAALAAFIAREGHDRVPKRHREAGVGLGEWLYRRRKKGVLSVAGECMK